MVFFIGIIFMCGVVIGMYFSSQLEKDIYKRKK